MRGPASFSSELPSRGWYEPPDERKPHLPPGDDEDDCGEQDESDYRYEEERDLKIERRND